MARVASLVAAVLALVDGGPVGVLVRKVNVLLARPEAFIALVDFPARAVAAVREARALALLVRCNLLGSSVVPVGDQLLALRDACLARITVEIVAHARDAPATVLAATVGTPVGIARIMPVHL